MATISEDKLELFDLAMKKHLNNDFMIPQIGSLSEKNIHAVLKHYLEPDEDYHEIKIGRSFADICIEEQKHIYEIQTGNFSKLKAKLTRFLKDYHVTVVYPIISRKLINWVDYETGEITSSRVSPLKPSYHSIFNELVYIRDILVDENSHNLSFKIIELHASEYKLLDGVGKNNKKFCTKYTIVPTKLISEFDIEGVKSLKGMLTDIEGFDFEDGIFTISDVTNISKIPEKTIRCMVNVLKYIGDVSQDGKIGRKNAYKL